jgi:A/G-specific adenine glycosylase
MKPLRPTEISDFQNSPRAWFDTNKRDLPWRRTTDPYKIWVAEVMLQQTQVKTVIPYFNKFVVRYPDVLTLSKAPLEDILKSWENMGYYTRARNLHKAAAEITRDFGGRVPTGYKSFRGLPGVGDYIAAAVMSIAFGEPYAVVDGNVKRVLSRLFSIDAPVNHSASARIFKERATELLDRHDSGTFNQAMMELGATICRPRQPLCGCCPVQKHCAAYRTGQPMDYPVRKPKKKIPEYQIAIGVIFKDGRMLITRRKEDGLLGGLWEFPGGKIQEGESSEDACKREIEEEVNLEVDVIDFVTHVDHAYSHFKIAVDVYACRYRAGDLILDGPVDYRWILVDETDNYPFPAVNHRIFPHLKKIEIAE